MKRLRSLLEGLAFGICVLIVLAALAVVVVDRTGLLRDAILDAAGEVLGPDVAGLELDSARLHWSDPGLRLSGLRLADGRGDEVLRVDDLRVRLGLFPPTIAAVELDGARITVSRGGLEIVERWRVRSEAGGGPKAQVDWSETPFPELQIVDVELAIDSRGLLAVEPAWRGTLCRISLASSPQEDGRPWLGGEVVPELGPDRRLAPVRFSGSVNDRGLIALQASSTDLSLDVDALPEFLSSRLAVFGPWSATADLEIAARFEGLDPVPIESDLRLRVDDFRAPEEPSPLQPTDVTVLVQGRFDRAEGEDGQLLSLAAELDGRWRDSPVELALQAGRAAPEGASIAGSAWIPNLQLDEVTYDLAEELIGTRLGLSETRRYAANTIDALGIVGGAEVRLDFRRDRLPNADGSAHDATTLVARPTPGTTLVYRGWAGAKGSPIGFPVPVELDRGRVVIAVDNAADRVVQVGFEGMGGTHASGEVLFDGLILTAPGGREGLLKLPDLRLSLVVPSMDVDGGARVGLEGLGLTYDVDAEFVPRGGTIGAQLDIVQAPEEPMTRVALDLQLEGLTASWSALPVPLEDVQGELGLRFSSALIEAPRRSDDPRERPLRRRAVGLRLAAEARGPNAERVRIRTGLRDPELEFLGGPERHPAGTWAQLRSVHVEVDGVRLGSETDAVLAGIEPVALALEELSPSGTVDVEVRSLVWDRDRPSRLSVTAEPGELDLRIERLDTALATLRGQLRVERTRLPRAGTDGDAALEEQAAADLGLNARLKASTAGARGLRVDLRRALGSAPTGPTGSIDLTLSGFDPYDPRWPERALAAGAEEYLEAFDRFLELELGGRADLDLALRLNEALEPFGTPSLVAHLRRNDLGGQPLEVRALRGSVATDGTVFTVPELVGEVAGQRLTLEAVRVLPGERLDDLEREARGLLTRALPSGNPERVITARVDLLDARIDADLVARATATPPGADWQVLLDADDAQLLIALPAEGPPVLAVAGELRPHDVRSPPNLRLASAELSLAHAVVDGTSVRALGEVKRAFGEISGLSVQDASAIVSFVGGRLTLDGLQARFAGGRVAGQGALDGGGSLGGETLPGGRAASIELSAPYRFDLALAFTGLDVNQILSQVITGDGTDAGRLRGHLRLVGEPNDPLSLEGRGFVALENARLYSIPVVRALFKQLGFDATATFDWMRTQLTVRDGQLRMTDAVAHSPLVKLVGGGTLGLDGRLDHDYDLTYSLVDRLGLFSRLIYWFQSRVLRIAVRGDMARPRVILTNPLFELFGRGRQGPPRLPYPQIADLPERF